MKRTICTTLHLYMVSKLVCDMSQDETGKRCRNAHGSLLLRSTPSIPCRPEQRLSWIHRFALSEKGRIRTPEAFWREKEEGRYMIFGRRKRLCGEAEPKPSFNTYMNMWACI